MNLASHYSRFRVSERLLLTGHSHQAWPDVAFEAQQLAWLDAAALVDEKWSRAEEVAEAVRRGWRRLLNDPDADIALGQNTHELVVRLLSAVHPALGAGRAGSRTTILTTDGEFHTIRRQLDRLAEERVPVIKVAAQPAATLAERLARAVDDRTACVMLSSVLFETAEIVPNLGIVADACSRAGAACLIDAYHHLNVVPFDVDAMGVSQAFVVGGGYKYCQLGEGNCFLRLPPGCELRPVITGWFSEFGQLADASRAGEVRYATHAGRFAGATYDPTSHYRAEAVFAFHVQMGLSPGRLREISRQHVRRLREGVEALGVDPRIAHVVAIPDSSRAGFLAIRAATAGALVTALRERGVSADARGEILRLGPAPYLTDAQLDAAIGVLGEVLG